MMTNGDLLPDDCITRGGPSKQSHALHLFTMVFQGIGVVQIVVDCLTWTTGIYAGCAAEGSASY